MDDYIDETMLELDRFAIGQPVPRSEDPVLLRGTGWPMAYRSRSSVV